MTDFDRDIDEFEMHTIAPYEPSGVTDLDRIERLEADVLALRLIVSQLLDRHYAGSHHIADEVERDANGLLCRLDEVETFDMLSLDVQSVGENIANEMIEKAGRKKQEKEPKLLS